MKQHWQITTPAFEADHLNPSLNVSPWCGHRNFVYDLLNFLEPASVIELGTHYVPQFSFAVKDFRLYAPARILHIFYTNLISFHPFTTS